MTALTSPTDCGSDIDTCYLRRATERQSRKSETARDQHYTAIDIALREPTRRAKSKQYVPARSSSDYYISPLVIDSRWSRIHPAACPPVLPSSCVGHIRDATAEGRTAGSLDLLKPQTARRNRVGRAILGRCETCPQLSGI